MINEAGKKASEHVNCPDHANRTEDALVKSQNIFGLALWTEQNIVLTL